MVQLSVSPLAEKVKEMLTSLLSIVPLMLVKENPALSKSVKVIVVALVMVPVPIILEPAAYQLLKEIVVSSTPILAVYRLGDTKVLYFTIGS